MEVVKLIIKFIAGFFDFFKTVRKGDELHPTISFHTAHGTNIYLDEARSTVSRTASYNNGIVFSHRPININEIISVKIMEVRKYKGPLFFGFTTIDPGTLRTNEIRALRSPALANSETGSSLVWMKGLHYHEMTVDMILCYQLLPNGTVQYSVNGDEFESRLRGLSTNVPLWATFDVYGSVGRIKLIKVPTEFQFNSESDAIAQSTFSSPVPANAGLTLSSPGTLRTDPSASNSLIQPVRFITPPNSPTPAEHVFHTPFSSSEAFASESNKNCIICTDKPATTAFFKCGHLCLCYPCASRFIDRSDGADTDRKIYSCPICRTPVLDIMRVYFS